MEALLVVLVVLAPSALKVATRCVWDAAPVHIPRLLQQAAPSVTLVLTPGPTQPNAPLAPPGLTALSPVPLSARHASLGTTPADTVPQRVLLAAMASIHRMCTPAHRVQLVRSMRWPLPHNAPLALLENSAPSVSRRAQFATQVNLALQTLPPALFVQLDRSATQLVPNHVPLVQSAPSPAPQGKLPARRAPTAPSPPLLDRVSVSYVRMGTRLEAVPLRALSALHKPTPTPQLNTTVFHAPPTRTRPLVLDSAHNVS